MFKRFDTTGNSILITLWSLGRWISLLKPQSHLDVWCERVDIVWENYQHVQNRTCVPVNHSPTCSKRVSNVLETTNHRVDTVWVTFPERVYSVCEREPTCQTNIQRVPDVFVTC